jgi:hypothetical protein
MKWTGVAEIPMMMGAGGQPPASGGGERRAEAMNDGKGQLVTLTGGLAQGGGRRVLTAAEFQRLSAVPLEAEWFANIDNPRTRRAYRGDIHDFMGFVLDRPTRGVPSRHPRARARLAEDLEGRELGGATIRRKLAALSSLFEHLCDANAVTHNPVKGVKRPQG